MGSRGRSSWEVPRVTVLGWIFCTRLGRSVVIGTLSKALEEGESHHASPGDRDCSHGHRAAQLPGSLAQALQNHSPTSHLQITCLTFLSYSTTTLCAWSEHQQSCIFPQCLTLTRALQPGCAGCSQLWDRVWQPLGLW